VDDELEILAALRERSRRAVLCIFSLLSLLALAAGVAVHSFPASLGLAHENPEAIAHCFLFMGTSYALTMILWDWLFGHRV
jgi:hypothetical protein